MIRFTMRLYRMHDLDLMYLYKMPNISIQSIVKVMLKNYIKDRNSGCSIATRLTIPDVTHDIPLPKTAQFHITLIDGEDDDVISWIEQIPKGLRNSMLKNMLRTYLSFPLVAPYEKEITEMVKPTNKNNISIEKYNEVMEKNVKTGKKSNTPRKKIIKEPTVDEVLDKPLYSDNSKQIAKDITSSTEVLTQTPENIKPLTTNTKNEPSSSQNGFASVQAPLESDLFDDFESMMDNF